MSGEHIWSKWICELFPDIEVIVRRWQAGDAKPQEWEANSLDHEAKVVCKPCNEGWMSDLESQHAEPAMKDAILSANPQVLSTEKLASIATFAFKTAVIGDHMERGKLPFFPALTRRKFSHTLRPPLGFQVWIGCLSEHDRHYGIFRRRYFNSPPGVSPGFRLFVVTWGVGRFFFQSTALRWNKSKYRRNILPLLTQDKNLNPITNPVWPMLNGPLIAKWPPSIHIANDAVDQITDRWKRFIPGKFYW